MNKSKLTDWINSETVSPRVTISVVFKFYDDVNAK